MNLGSFYMDTTRQKLKDPYLSSVQVDRSLVYAKKIFDIRQKAKK
jgi:hypothetical protein